MRKSIIFIGIFFLMIFFGAMSRVNAEIKGDIKIGCAASGSGQLTPYGTSQYEGMQLGVVQINQAGGVKGNKIVLIREDDLSTKEGAINALKKLIYEQKVCALVGPISSTLASAAWPEAEKGKCVAIGTTTTAKGQTDRWKYAFRTALPEEDVLPVTVEAIKKKLGVKKVSVMYDRDDVYSTSAYHVFMDALKNAGVEILSVESYVKADVDLTPQLTKIWNLKPDTLVVPAMPEAGARIVIQSRRIGIPFSVRIIGGNAFNSAKLIEMCGKDAEGLIVGTPWFRGTDTPINKQFVESFTKMFNHPPDQFAAQSFVALQAIVEAIKMSNSTDRTEIRDAMTKIKNLPTILGHLEFDDNRTIKPTGVVVTEVKNGEFTEFKWR